MANLEFNQDQTTIKLTQDERLAFEHYATAAQELGLIKRKASKTAFIKMCIEQQGKRMLFATRNQLTLELPEIHEY